MVNYKPRINVHEQRMGSWKTKGPNRLLVLHTSQGPEGDNSAEGLANYLRSPGDRPQEGREPYGSSYQYIVDTDGIFPAVDEMRVSYSASGANHDGIHLCIPGDAFQSRAQWLDTTSRAYIKQTAELLVDRSEHTNIPLTRLTPSQIVAGEWGVCDHNDIRLAYKETSHTDVGKFFPWDVLYDDIDKILHPFVPPPNTPPGVPDMSQAQAFVKNDVAIFVQYDGWKYWLPEGHDVTMYNNLRVLNGQAPLDTTDLTGNKAAMHALGPIIGPVPNGWDPWGSKL